MQTAWSNDEFTQNLLKRGAEYTTLHVDTEEFSGTIDGYKVTTKDGPNKITEAFYKAEHKHTIPANEETPGQAPIQIYGLKLFFSQTAQPGPNGAPGMSVTSFSVGNEGKALNDAIGWTTPKINNGKITTITNANEKIELGLAA